MCLINHFFLLQRTWLPNMFKLRCPMYIVWKKALISHFEVSATVNFLWGVSIWFLLLLKFLNQKIWTSLVNRLFLKQFRTLPFRYFQNGSFAYWWCPSGLTFWIKSPLTEGKMKCNNFSLLQNKSLCRAITIWRH